MKFHAGTIMVTGRKGWIGSHVEHWLGVMNHVVVDTLEDKPQAMIHLWWPGLPNYESNSHFENVGWSYQQIAQAAKQGVRNITVVGTCLEGVPNPPAYARAKTELREALERLDINLKWLRLFYLYGINQRPNCLIPQLRAAMAREDKTFSVIDGARDFIDVREAARVICRAAAQDDVTGIIDVCSGVAEPVIDFCRRQIPAKCPIELVADYPIPSYEPKSFHGDPTKMKLFA